jgi:hypothetical protein
MEFVCITDCLRFGTEDDYGDQNPARERARVSHAAGRARNQDHEQNEIPTRPRRPRRTGRFRPTRLSPLGFAATGVQLNTSPRWVRGAKAERRNPATRPTCPCRGALTCPPRPPWLEQNPFPPPARCVPERAAAREPARATLPRPHITPRTDPHQS